jgi:hypothetical protein
MQQRPIPYHWVAEAHPTLRTRIMVYWAGRLATTRRHWHSYQTAPWLSGAWHTAALCIHNHEGSWTDTTPTYMGGMQFDASTWSSNGGVGNPGAAPIAVQLRIAYRAWQARGWGPWPNTRLMCGL